MTERTPSWAIGGELDQRYKSAFNRAEHAHRWRLDADINWKDAAPSADRDLVTIVETFWAVESFLPDYTASLASMHRTERGRAWVHALWAYEEARHSRALEEWLLRGKHRTDSELDTLSQRMWQQCYTLPYADERKLVIYQMFQEAATRTLYVRLRHLASSIGDGALSDICRFISADEFNHYRFFRDVVLAHLSADREATTSDVYEVGLSFAMPALELIPDSDERYRVFQSSGLASIRIGLEDVWLSVATSLGIDPLPPPIRRWAGPSADLGALVAMAESMGDVRDLGSALREAAGPR
jgi:acyl-[acyl-carrier-protein] desaturase